MVVNDVTQAKTRRGKNPMIGLSSTKEAPKLLW